MGWYKGQAALELPAGLHELLLENTLDYPARELNTWYTNDNDFPILIYCTVYDDADDYQAFAFETELIDDSNEDPPFTPVTNLNYTDVAFRPFQFTFFAPPQSKYRITDELGA